MRAHAPSLRGLGIGRQVLHAAEGASRRRGFEWAELGVARSNVDARRMYERAGYHVVGEVRDELILEKYLLPFE